MFPIMPQLAKYPIFLLTYLDVSLNCCHNVIGRDNLKGKELVLGRQGTSVGINPLAQCYIVIR